MNRGHTLVELLLALVLLGAMSVLLFNGLWLGLRTWDAVGTRARAAHDLHLALRFVAAQVEQAREISGERDRLDLAAWRIATERDESGERRLVARSESEEVVVARNLQDVHFSYRAVDGSWTSRWDGSLGLPALVRLRLVPQFPAAGAPPDLVVAPRLRDARAEP